MKWRVLIGDPPDRDFAFVGRVEAFEDSLARFCREFGFSRSVGLRENCKSCAPDQPLSGLIRRRADQITALNEQDFEIYRTVTRLAEKAEAA